MHSVFVTSACLCLALLTAKTDSPVAQAPEAPSGLVVSVISADTLEEAVVSSDPEAPATDSPQSGAELPSPGTGFAIKPSIATYGMAGGVFLFAMLLTRRHRLHHNV